MLLEIEALKIRTFIGVHAWEKKIEQLLIITLSLTFEMAALADKLENTIDYVSVCEYVKSFFKLNNFSLIEIAACELAQALKQEYKLEACSVKISKPGALAESLNVSALFEI